MRIAQRFIAGFKTMPLHTSPVGTTEEGTAFTRPYGTLRRVGVIFPAMNRWAIVISSLRDDGRRNIRDRLGRCNLEDFAL